MNQTPITKKTFTKLSSHWAKLIQDGEFATFVWPPRAEPIRRIIEFIRNEELQNQLGLDTQKTVFAIIDFKDEPTVAKGELYADILWELSRELREKGRLVDELDALTLLKHLESEGYRVVLFVLGLDRMLEKHDISLVKEIALIYKRFVNVSVFCFLRIYLSPEMRKSLNDETVFTNTNIFYTQVYSVEDSSQFITFMEEQWNMKISDTQRTFILDNFAGKLGTVKNALRILRANPTLPLKSLIRDESIIERGKLTLQAFHPSVLTVVRKIQEGSYKFSKEDDEAMSYLIHIGMVKCHNDTYSLFPVFLQDIRLELPNEGIVSDIPSTFASENLNSLLTFQEQRVFKTLLENKGAIISRDRIADDMWESDVDEKYSNWAIDQLMYRLRQRLAQAKLPFILKTRRGQGFMLLDTR